MEFLSVIEQMKQAGVHFSVGLTDEEISKIEEIYKISFPQSLRAFYSIALPVCTDKRDFPKWNDFSQENIDFIREQMNLPYQWLKRDIENGFWLPMWGKRSIDELLKNAPKLIPIYAHRYMPSINISNPPVLSTVGRDTIWYGFSLQDYLAREFCNERPLEEPFKVAYVPLWSDIIESH